MPDYWDRMDASRTSAALTRVHEARTEVRRLEAEREGIRECLKAQGYDPDKLAR